MSDPTSKPPDALPVKIKDPKELPKISLVNESLKKLKFHLAKFYNVVKIRTTPNARTEGKETVDIAAQKPSANTIVPGMLKLDLEPLAPRNMKNKVEAQPRNVNKKNRVVEPICNVDVKKSQLNANSEPICATCKKSMFNGVHDLCLLDFMKNVNSHAKSAKKHKIQNIWKPTGRTFTIVGNLCPLTKITSANVVPPKKTTSYLVETKKP
nr:hypothetical protein [Tanacetum cinerariifolium]